MRNPRTSYPHSQPHAPFLKASMRDEHVKLLTGLSSTRVQGPSTKSSHRRGDGEGVSLPPKKSRIAYLAELVLQLKSSPQLSVVLLLSLLPLPVPLLMKSLLLLVPLLLVLSSEEPSTHALLAVPLPVLLEGRGSLLLRPWPRSSTLHRVLAGFPPSKSTTCRGRSLGSGRIGKSTTPSLPTI